jgi:signal transduction histidine kinase
VAAVLTALVVAVVVGPPLVVGHLARAVPAVPPEVVLHAQEAFRSATAIAFSIALLASLGAAVAVSLWVTRRIGRSVESVADAAATVAHGRYDVRVPPPALGAEFEVLAESFNQMAGQLEMVETTRRRLLADLAHEMRNPVATLDAYLEGLQDGVTSFDAETAAMLRTPTHRLSRLAEDISAVSRVEERQVPLTLRPLAVADLTDGAMSLASARFAAKGVRLDNMIPDDVPALRGDADRLGQVLANLLDNALRHTPGGGSVTVSARSAHDGIELVVADTGEGIEAQHLGHVFERFYRADAARDRDHGGSGIGLAISKALVDAHGGHIDVTSEGAGRGTTFVLWLPAA